MVRWKSPVISFTQFNVECCYFKIILLVDLDDESCIGCAVLGVTVFVCPALYKS